MSKCTCVNGIAMTVANGNHIYCENCEEGRARGNAAEGRPSDYLRDAVERLGKPATWDDLHKLIIDGEEYREEIKGTCDAHTHWLTWLMSMTDEERLESVKKLEHRRTGCDTWLFTDGSELKVFGGMPIGQGLHTKYVWMYIRYNGGSIHICGDNE